MNRKECPKFDRFCWGIIHRKVRQLIGIAGFTKQDREDLVQEFVVRLIEALRSYDAAYGHRYRFVTAVVERTTANILRDKRAEKRDWRRVGSLSASVESENGPCELADTIVGREAERRLGTERRTDIDLVDLRNDVDGALKLLPKELRALARRLRFESLAAIARDLKIPRTTLREKLRKIRFAFENAGIRDCV